MFYKTKIENVYVIGLQDGDEVSIDVKEIAIKMELGTAKLFNNLCNFNGKRMDNVCNIYK